MASPLRTTPSVEKDLSEIKETSSAMKTIIARAEETKKKAALKVDATKASAIEMVKVVRGKLVEIVSEKSVQVTAASAVGGAGVGGVGGMTGGFLLGGATGALMGVVPAVFTFGLSIPAGAALGAGCGLLMGGAVGTATGAGAGGAAGYGAYTKRSEIASFMEKVRAKLVEGFGRGKSVVADAKAKASQKLEDAKDNLTLVKGFVMSQIAAAQEKTLVAVDTASGRAREVAKATKVKTIEIASDKKVQVTAASAASGAAVLGSGGAAVGFATGGAVGAVVGVVPAFFTFGLSIPVFAAVGSSCGLVTGAVVGGTTGLVGGGATGYGVYTKRDAISSSVTKTLTKVDSTAKLVKETASNSAEYVRNRLVGATGGTTD